MNKELRNILSRLDELLASGITCALATVVNVQGSAYRRPGARMLLSEQGREMGFVSAACMEHDLFEKAKTVMAKGTAELFSYDTTAPEDAIFGIGQGCGGFVEILIEPVTSMLSASSLKLLQTASSQDEACALATVFRTNEPESLKFGKLLVTKDGTTTSADIPAEWHTVLARDAEEVLKIGRSTTRHYEIAGCRADVLIECIHPAIPLVIFGATPDVKPLVRLGVDLGWHVSVIDHRSAYAQKKDFPEADAVLLLSPEEYAEHLHLTPETCAVVMIHQFAAEANALRFLLSSSIRYVGLLGPRSKCGLLFQHLSEEGFIPTEGQLARFHNPVGLDLGTETAEEIALSIVAEIQAINNNRSGGFLKDRQGPIHEKYC